ncbi:MAG: aminoglycoside phosphotransferase family protein [Deltaproteobacteria bacterium]|jgi:tRNA A-37 threonylcarbamoyl transferase component Bud32|nr:aminoglycoside phosphotransferase family protein [Deltaproteobacteria bacterium]
MACGTPEVILAQRPSKVIRLEGNRVLKVFGQGFSVADVLNESLNQARVMESGLRIPELLEVRKVEDGKWAIVMEYVEGQTLAKSMSDCPERADELMAYFVDIHIESCSRRVRLLNSLREKMIRQIDEASLDPAARYDLHARVESMPRRSSLCHGDFNPSNIIMAKEGPPCILDWSHATQGDPAADVARTYLLFRLERKEKEAEKYLALMAGKSGISPAEVQRWLPLVAACQTLKGDSRKRDFLMRWVNVFDFE